MAFLNEGRKRGNARLAIVAIAAVTTLIGGSLGASAASADGRARATIYLSSNDNCGSPDTPLVRSGAARFVRTGDVLTWSWRARGLSANTEYDVFVESPEESCGYGHYGQKATTDARGSTTGTGTGDVSGSGFTQFVLEFANNGFYEAETTIVTLP